MVVKKYKMVLQSVQSDLLGWLTGNRRQIVADANCCLLINKIILSVLLSVAMFLFIPNSLAQSEGTDDEYPILTFMADICEIEITSYELDLLFEAPLDFYAAYESRMHCESPPPHDQYKCRGCRDKNITFYECFHTTMDPRIPCDRNFCIKNETYFKSCYVSNRGREDCRVVVDPHPEGSYGIQYKIRARQPCNSSRNDPYILFSVWVGCPLCVELPQVVRCTVPSCPGDTVESSRRRGRFLCMPEPCPPPRRLPAPSSSF